MRRVKKALLVFFYFSFFNNYALYSYPFGFIIRPIIYKLLKDTPESYTHLVDCFKQLPPWQIRIRQNGIRNSIECRTCGYKLSYPGFLGYKEIQAIKKTYGELCEKEKQKNLILILLKKGSE